MFEVLVFVYQNYWRGGACPQSEQLGRRLSAHGFEDEPIQQALQWLDDLNLATQGVLLAAPLPAGEDHALAQTDDAAVPGDAEPAIAGLRMAAPIAPSAHSMRIYSVAEQDHLGADGLGFIGFLASAGVLNAGLREVVIDRAMASPGSPIALDDLKIIVLMVHWRAGIEPDALVLDELTGNHEDRVAH